MIYHFRSSNADLCRYRIAVLDEDGVVGAAKPDRFGCTVPTVPRRGADIHSGMTWGTIFSSFNFLFYNDLANASKLHCHIKIPSLLWTCNGK